MLTIDQLVQQFPQYYKPCPYNVIDVYRVIALFGVTDPCVQHAIKKLLLSGVRTGGKPATQDIEEAIATLSRYLVMDEEDKDVQFK